MNPVMIFLDAIRDHLDLHVLPPVSSIDITKWTNPITVQLDADDLAGVSRALLAWANTLDTVTAHIQRMKPGDSVHLSIYGRTPCGVLVKVYGGVPFAEDTFPDLPVGIKQDVPLFIMRRWADSAGEVAA
ncbi:hypothetical protein OG943_40970 [Amycolatopsis sp. NBC_00345]|uniref:hypothetical protein n=1 Tax=Amycolatopsis sp. NBC_00345 TaxID=2975955 RepID=UPI002E26FA48